MASLTGCIKKAGKALSADDKAAILKAAQEHRADGMKATEAGRKAIADLLEAVRAELAEVEAARVEAPVYIPFEESQVKSAIGNKGTFDESNPNILKQSAYTGSYETDIFGNPLPEAQRTSRRARPAAPAVPGDVQPASGVQGDTPAPAGDYHIRTTVGVTAQRKLGAKTIKTAADAAAATSYLYRSAVERFDAIVTDKDGKPLAVVGGFKGALSQASVYASTLVGEAVRIPGAARIWFSHNHPSGLAILSRADEHLAQALANVFKGSGIEPMGLIAVAGDKFAHSDYFATESIPPAVDGPTAPVIERELAPDGKPGVLIQSPAEAKDAAAAHYKAGGPGILLLNAQNRVVGWVPLSGTNMMGPLRNTGGLNAIYRAVSEANVGAAILTHGGELDAKPPGVYNTLGENIGGALSMVDVRVLDIINAETMESAAERGLPTAASAVFQGGDTPRAQIAFGQDVSAAASVITLLDGADWSSFLHEAGHFFLEVHADIAIKIQQQMAEGASVTDLERGIVEDFNAALRWMGVTGTEDATGKTGGVMDQAAFHGTPYRGIDKFSTDYIGTGEGAQAYGWGLYFAGKKEIADFYRRKLTDGANATQPYYYQGGLNNPDETQAWRTLLENFSASDYADARDIPKETLSAWADSLEDDGQPGAANALREFDPKKIVREDTGQLYEVDIPEDSEMLLWDRPLSEQPEKVRKVLESLQESTQAFTTRKAPGKGNRIEIVAPDGTGMGYYEPGEVDEAIANMTAGYMRNAGARPLNAGDVYERLAKAMQRLKEDQIGGPVMDQATGRDFYRTMGPKAASDALAAAGIKGIKYLDGSYNYVIFSGDDVAIRQTFYQGGEQVPQEFPAQGRTPLDTWAMMSMAEKTYYHERFARGFEAYAFEGKAPSIALQGVFNRFRAWLKDVYRWLLKAHGDRLDAGLDAKLSPDIRGVMDRMIATDEAIEEAEAARGFLPLFKTAEEAARLGWSPEKWQKYQALGHDATDDAKAKLSERALKDMKWLGRARDKALKARQREVEDQRREVRAEIRMEVYSEPVYRAWQFLTGKGDDDNTAKGEGLPKGSRSVDVAKDSLLVAIAKLGGISRDSAKRDAGVSDDDLTVASGVFGAPVFRKTGGRNADDMRELLTELGYLHDRDEFGRTDLRGLSDAISNELGGAPEYSFSKDYGPDASGDKIGEEQFFGKLNTDDLRLRYGNSDTAVWRKLSALRMTSDTGLDADVVAEFFEFDSGDALVRALAEATPPREAIEARTDERMLQMFGDITSPEALARAADEAVMNKVRAKFLASEWKALEDATTKKEKRGKRSVDLMAIAAKEYAAQIVARLKVRDIKPAKYAAAAARNGKLSAKAFTSAKLEEAAMHKRNQTVNAYAADAAYEALHEVEKARAYLRKFDKRIKSIEPAYQDQINAILERFDLRKASRDEAAKARAEARTQAQIAAAQARLDELDAADPTNERAALADWIASLDPDKGDVIPALSEAVLNEANRKSYKDMTLEELRGMVDDVRQLEHLGRTKNRLLKSKAKRDLDKYADDASASIRKSKDVRKIDREGEPAWRDHSADALATMRKMSSLARQMDAGDESGPLFEGLIRPANEAGAWDDERLSKEHAELLKIVSEVAALPDGLTGRKVRTPLGVSLTRGAQLAVLLNAGNEVNLQRMEAGDGWSMAQVQALAATMTPTELNFVNKTWAYLETFWPEVQALEKRMTGVAPEKVEAAPWVATASDGTKITMTGGYYPIVYSRDLNDATAKQESAKELMEAARGAVSRGMTRHSHTKKRAEKVARKLKLNLDVISSHVEQVVHDLAWREWVTDANRILNHKDISLAIHEHYGPRVLQAMREQVAAIATGDIKPRDAWHKSLMWARNNTSRAVMGFSATTAFLQPFGVLQSVVRIGAVTVLKGYRRWVGDAAQLESSLTWITDKSTMMKHRAKTFNREVKELNRVMEGKSKAADVLDTALFFAMQKMQLVADIPTWIGQYEKTLQEASDRAKAEGRFGDEVLEEIEAEAVAQADRAVIESQGSGEVKDLAGVQRNWPMLTMFYSYFSATWQMTAESTARTNFRNPRAVAGWLADMLLLNVVPAIGPALLLMFLKGMGDDDEENERKLAEKAAEAQFSYLVNMIPLVREAQGVFGPFDYQGPPVGMIVGALSKAAKQTEQVAAAYLEGDADAAFENMDEAFVKSYIRLLGLSFGLPVVQAQRMWDGWKAWDEGREGAGPQSVLFGPPAR